MSLDVGEGAPATALRENVEDGTPVIALVGEWDISSAPQLRLRLESFDAGDVIVDLRATTFVDSTILSVLIDLQRRLAAAGFGARLRLPERGIIRRVFEMMSLESLFGTPT
jgi:anti-anti-sigma factor